MSFSQTSAVRIILSGVVALLTLLAIELRNRLAFPKPVRVVASVGVVALLLLAQARAAQASTITVDTTMDETNIDGNCSLREAITAANTDTAVDACTGGSGADIIVVPVGTYTLNISGAGEDANQMGDLDITSDLTINGAGGASTIIDGARLDRVFDIHGPATVTITGVTVSNGFASVSQDLGGGIRNDFGGALTVNNTTVSGNSATFFGGGIANHGTLNLTNSILSGNSARQAGGAIYSAGAVAAVALNNTRVIGNSTQFGGGIANAGTLSLTNSVISGNSAPGGGGGGIISGFSNAAVLVTITGTTLSGNSTANVIGPPSPGGGIYNSNPSILSLSNSTVSGNSGSGIFNTGGGTLSIANSTVSSNSFGILSGGAAALKNTIVANSTAPGGVNCSSRGITSLGHNLSSDGSCASAFTQPGDLNNMDPMLGPLTNNGGPTDTQALLPGSPAIDAGSSDCPPPPTDQRGVSRPQDGDGNGSAICDIGAFELEAAPTPGKVTGGGQIVGDPVFSALGDLLSSPALIPSLADPTAQASFGFVAQCCPATGNLEYDDHPADVRIKAISFTALFISSPGTACPATPGSKHAEFTGMAAVIRSTGTTTEPFTVRVDDCSEPGTADQFGIETTSYSNGPVGIEETLIGGNIQIH